MTPEHVVGGWYSIFIRHRRQLHDVEIRYRWLVLCSYLPSMVTPRRQNLLAVGTPFPTFDYAIAREVVAACRYYSDLVLIAHHYWFCICFNSV